MYPGTVTRIGWVISHPIFIVKIGRVGTCTKLPVRHARQLLEPIYVPVSKTVQLRNLLYVYLRLGTCTQHPEYKYPGMLKIVFNIIVYTTMG